ncbi:MAG: metal ABC transporter substrate-binding protein [Longimicrobiales bacterium]
MNRLLLGSALLTLGACAPSPPAEDDVQPLIVASIHPVADLLARIGGDAVRVEALLPPRAAPDTWELTPSRVRLLASAEGYVTVGAGLDGWVDGLGEVGPRPTARLRLTDHVTLSESDHAHGHGVEEGDPHVWLDPILVRDDLLPVLTEFVVSRAPEAADAIRARGGAVADSLTALDAWIRRELTPVSGRGFVATHGAWGYFSRRYGVESLGSVYERPGHEPSATGLAALVRSARAAGLAAILTEPQLADGTARALAREVGAAVEIVDPLGGPGLDGRETYYDMMRFNARAFARAMADR